MIDKEKTFNFWNEASCGEDTLLRKPNRIGYERQFLKRYRLEPYIQNSLCVDFLVSQGYLC
tara:strand:+ start:512 stop:694 length:183 start_codon:yes stop_codon:yes gene_type:complete